MPNTLLNSAAARRLWLYYAVAAVCLTLIVASFSFTSNVARQLDAPAVVFYALGAVLQGMLFAAIPLALGALLLRFHRAGEAPAGVVAVAGITLIELFLLVDLLVFRLYNFHIGAALLNALLDERAGQVWHFDAVLWLRLALIAVALAAVNIGLYRLCRYLPLKGLTVKPVWCLATVVALSLVVNAWHAVVAARATGRSFRPAAERAMLRSYEVLPLFYPLRCNSLLERLGVREAEPSNVVSVHLGGDLLLPNGAALLDSAQGKRCNIVLLLVDELRADCLNDSVTPCLWSWGQGARRYTHHRSSGNQTTGGVYGLFAGLPPFYAETLIDHHRYPPLLEALVGRGYDIETFPSATLTLPAFHEVVFGGVPGGVRTDTPGADPYQRDCRVADDLCQFLDTAAADRPFFAFAFFDLAHAYEPPADKLYRFQPSWRFADYMALNYDTDPLPMFNLYRNCVHVIDSLCGRVLGALKGRGLDKRTIVVVTGDHGEEFNDHGNNYWGHGYNLTRAQTAVPLLYKLPGDSAAVCQHPTTHYDVACTLLRDALGCRADPQTYSEGRYLDDPAQRPWHCIASSKKTGETFVFSKIGDAVCFVLDDERTVVLSDQGPVVVNDAFEQLPEPVDTVALAQALERVQRFAPPKRATND